MAENDKSLKKQISQTKRISVYDVDLRPGHPPTGYIISLIHLLKANIGVGLFAMGDAFKNGGIYVSPIMTVLIALICVHCQHVLVDCANRVSREYNKDDDPVDYAYAVELCFENGPKKVASWSEKMGLCINIFLCITQLGFCCVYLLFISSNIQQILEANGLRFDLRILILVIWFPIWISCLITNLKALAPVSMIANMLLFASFSATIVLAFIDGIPTDISERNAYTTPWKLSLFFGTIIFAYEGISLVLPIKNVMRNPSSFAKPYGVLNVSMLIVVLMYILAGMSGYLKWGEDVGGSLTLNLGNTIIAQCVKGAASIGIMFTYPLQFFVPIQVLLPGFLSITHLLNREMIGEMLFRTLLTIGTVIIAEIVPNVGIFVSLIGAFCSTALALVFPPLIECLLLHQSDQTRCIKSLILLKNIMILILATMGFTVGTTISLLEIVKYLREILGKDYLKKA